jgi:hypothetical protein
VGAREEVADRVDIPSSQTTSRFGGAVGAALLMAVLFALVLGVYGSVTFDGLTVRRLKRAFEIAVRPVLIGRAQFLPYRDDSDPTCRQSA